MKKFLTILAVALVFVSCGSNSTTKKKAMTQRDAEEAFLSTLTDASQKQILDMAETCMTLLRDGEIEKAVKMIYVLQDNVVYQKSESYTQSLENRFKIFRVQNFTRDYYCFSTEGNNDISYTMELAQEADGTVPTMKLMFNPVYVDGEWFLCLKDAGMSSKALPVHSQVHDDFPAPAPITVNRDRQ